MTNDLHLSAILQNYENLWFRTGEVNQNTIPNQRQFEIRDYEKFSVQFQKDLFKSK